MPVRWSLRLSEPVPEASAAQLHGLTCALVEDSGSPHTEQIKPFSAAGPHQEDGDPVIEVNWLDDLPEPDVAGRAAAGPLRLGSHPVAVAEVRQRAESYADLAATAPRYRLRVEFRSPTYVSRAGRQFPLPDPELLLTGLARRWRHFSPSTFGDAALPTLLNSVHIARHELRTVPVYVAPGRRVVGFTGKAVFGLPDDTAPAAARLLAALWRFAEYAGAGAQTTHGLGRVRLAKHTRGGRVSERSSRQEARAPTGQQASREASILWEDE